MALIDGGRLEACVRALAPILARARPSAGLNLSPPGHPFWSDPDNQCLGGKHAPGILGVLRSQLLNSPAMFRGSCWRNHIRVPVYQDIPELVPIFGIMVDDQRCFWMRLQISHPCEIFRWHSLWLAVERGKELALVKDKTYRQHVRLAVRLDGGQTRHSCFGQLHGDSLWNI